MVFPLNKSHWLMIVEHFDWGVFHILIFIYLLYGLCMVSQRFATAIHGNLSHVTSPEYPSDTIRMTIFVGLAVVLIFVP
jgi:hypothetical protein